MLAAFENNFWTTVELDSSPKLKMFDHNVRARCFV